MVEEQAASISSSRKLTLPVDPEHAALRVTVLLSFLIVTVVGYLVVDRLAPQQGFINLLGLIIGLVAGTIIIQILDRVLKKTWPSGRVVEIDNHQIRLSKGGQAQFTIDGSQHVNVLMWRFEITRRARAPKGWYVVSLALNQEDEYLTVYTFMSAKDFDALAFKDEFVPLTSTKGQKNDATQDLRAAGQERRLRTAESFRWMSGGELSKEEFVTLIEALQQHFPDWMPE